MAEDIISLWRDLVERTASFISRDFPDVEREELVQQLFLFVVENGKYLKEPTQVGSAKALSRAAKQYAWDQRKEHLTLSSQYSYRTSDVKYILETVFDARDWEGVRVPEDAQSEFNDVFLEINSDVKRAWEKLGYAQKQVIFRKYALGWEPETQTETKRLYRAIVALTDNLNWYQHPKGHQHVGTRRAITNANARYNIDGLT